MLCTFRRPLDLLRCLDGLAAQTVLPDEVLVVVRPTDTDTHAALGSRPSGELRLRIVPVEQPGLIAARSAGLDACTTDIVAMTDDDTVPHPDWIERICNHFLAHPEVGGVGGRDRCKLADGRWNDNAKPRVGEIQWLGRLIGYHHLGVGPARKVMILKGANMSYRMSAVGSLRVDRRLRGSGAQPHEDSMFSVAMRRRGHDLLYDPAVLVDHYEGHREEPRHYSVMLPVQDARAFREVAFNWVIVLWTEFSAPRHLPFILWNLFVGTRIAPGLVQALRFTPTMGLSSWHRFWLTQRGTYEAYRLLLREPKLSPAPLRSAAAGPA